MQREATHIGLEETWNEDVFQEMYDTYYRVMVCHAMKYVTVQEQAEDIVQETFLKLWTSKAAINDQNSFLRMLHVSVRNRCLDYLKHQAVERSFSANATPESESSVEESIFAAEIYGRLMREIDSLPSRQRDTMLLVCEGKTNAEIAEAMSVGMETVKNQKYKAMQALKKKFSETTLMLLMPALCPFASNN